MVTLLDTPVQFDYDLDGQPETILGWPKFSPDNRVGLIIYKSGEKFQLLGNTSKLHGQSGFTDGHDALSILDQNKDGILNSGDKIFDKSLFIWFDKNNNARLDKDELTTFQKMHVKSINVKNIVSLNKAVSHPQLAYIDSANTVKSTKKNSSAIIYDLWFTRR